MTFQTTTMIIATVVLIICLIIIGYMLNKNKYNSQYPPVISECPDYWLDRSDGDGSNCLNSQGLGRTNCAKKWISLAPIGQDKMVYVIKTNGQKHVI